MMRFFTAGEKARRGEAEGIMVRLDTGTDVRAARPLDACRDNEAPGDGRKDAVPRADV